MNLYLKTKSVYLQYLPALYNPLRHCLFFIGVYTFTFLAVFPCVSRCTCANVSFLSISQQAFGVVKARVTAAKILIKKKKKNAFSKIFLSFLLALVMSLSMQDSKR